MLSVNILHVAKDVQVIGLELYLFILVNQLANEHVERYSLSLLDLVRHLLLHLVQKLADHLH